MEATHPEGNVETVHRIYEGFDTGDLETIAATWAPGVVFEEPVGLLGGETFHGRREILENVFDGTASTWADATVTPEQFVEDGDTVVVLVTWRASAMDGAKSVEYPGAHVFEFDDGAVARWTSYGDTELFDAAIEG